MTTREKAERCRRMASRRLSRDDIDDDLHRCLTFAMEVCEEYLRRTDPRAWNEQHNFTVRQDHAIGVL